MEKTNMKILGWTIGMLVIVALILTIGLTTTFIRASGRFNLPLSWILSPSGVSVDLDNNGIVDNVDSVPSGLIAMFDTDCPSGWTRVTALDGKFLVASSTYNASAGGSDSITLAEANLPSHTHSVDPPSTASGSQSASHSHGMTHTHSINPPAKTSNSTGAHTHTLEWRNDYVTWGGGRLGYLPPPGYMEFTFQSASAGAHTHSVDIGSFTSGGSSSGSTGSQSASHTHTTDIGSFTSGATGSGTAFDNRPAYATIVICQKD